MGKLCIPNQVDYDNTNGVGVSSNFDNSAVDETIRKLDFSKVNASNPADVESKREMAIKYLNSKTNFAELLENPFAHVLIAFIRNSTREYIFKEQVVRTVKQIIEISYDKTVMALLDFQFENLSKLNLRADKKEEINEANIKLSLIKAQLITLLNITDISYLFCDKLYEANAIKILFKLVNNEFLNDVIQNVVQIDQVLENVIHDLFKIAIGILYNLSKLKEKFVNEWNQVNATKSLLNMVNSLSKVDMTKFKSATHTHNTAYILVANIATDEEIESLKEISLVMSRIVDKIVSSFIKKLNDGTKIQRSHVQLYMEDENGMVSTIEVARVTDGWSCIELMDACYHLTVCDKVKHELYFTLNMSEHLRTIIYKGNPIEAMYALKLIYQLCFDKRIAAHVKDDSSLVEKITNLNVSLDSNALTKKSCQGILWLIDESNSVKDSSDQQKKHIMISYNRESRDLCLKIKSELEKMNYSVWIDVENIHGSSLESMALAIENSMCVLMCMTEKYKQSTYCRAEAEYAFNINRPIVPIIMQKDYKPTGWLAFSECITRLRQEIINIEPVTNTKITAESSIRKNTTTNLPNTVVGVTEWKENDVEKWFKDEEINTLILNDLKPCDGLILNQLYEILKTSPDFFYSALTVKNKEINLRDVAVFTCKLKNLFKN